MKKTKNREHTDGRTAVQPGSGKWIIRVLVAAVIIVGIVFAGKSYVNHYYPAEMVAQEALQGNGHVTVTETEEYYCFAPEEAADTGIIFYPGAKIEESAYAPMLTELAECGYTVYLMRMPARLAVLKPDAADLVIEDALQEASGIRQWILMGHSLGGAMAAAYAADHSDQVDALVLLAAYSTKDLNGCDIPVLSIYGSEDGVLDLEQYRKCQGNLPADTFTCVIDGGNHAGYAFYGEQKGDGAATISPDEQQQTVVDEVIYWSAGLE